MSEDNAVSTEAEEREPGSTHTSAHELGDITAQRLQGGLRKLAQTVGTEGDGVDYYRFTLSEAREVRLGLKLREGEAELYLEDAEGNVLARSMAHAGYEAAVRTLLPGTYYVRVEAVGAAASEYEFRYGVLEANASFRPASDSPWHTGLAEQMGMPSFGEAGYGFELSETVDGRVSGVLLGTVLAVDPNGEELSYRIVGGNGSGLFALGGASGELSYVGAGEDFEGGAGSYELTVRASDGTHTIDTTVTVTITDAAEAPAFGEGSYAFALTENVDGSVSRVLLGVVEATDPDSDGVRYSLVGGNDSSLFAIEETSGELFYVGAGEDFEGGVTSYELTIRASDGTHTIDTTVTVTVTDAAEQPAFGEESYAFELAENADGRANGLSLGRVLATDPDGDEVRYSLTGGNELFTVDETSGELYYVGPGEDYESGVTSYEVTVRASDAAHTVDTTVTVTVTDAAEAPAFGEESYTFALAENVDGRVNGLSLGSVTATDPDSDTVRYSLVGGNDSSLFAINETSGELFYVGAGEDFEGGVTSYGLTVRASDAAHTVDTTVMVTVTDAAEAPAFGEESYAFELAENVDGRVNRLSLGTVTATDPDSDGVRYSLVGGNDSSLFAIGETSGELYYVGLGEDYESGVTSYELTVRASDGTHTIDTTVTVTVTDAAEQPAFGEESYAFELAENADGRANGLSLGRVLATDPDGDEVRYSLTGGNELFTVDEASGELYYVGPGEDYESGVTSYEVTVRASDAAHTVDTTVTVTVTDEAEAPAFAEESYAFELAENVDGRVNRLSLGSVTATDPDSDTVRYSLLDGNDSSLFAIEETSGELFYVGAGEDFEGGVTSYELTVRASDAAHTVDTTVTVTVTDAAEAPAFAEESYAFELAENVDGRVNRLSLGTVTATDPDSDTVRYSLLDGNDSSLFAIEETSGELYYVGPGEDYESGVTSYEVTVRASDAAHTVDTTVTVTVTDEAEAPAFGEGSYAFELTENVDGSVSRVLLGVVEATDPDSDTVRYSLLVGNDSSLFAIEETSGELFYVGSGEDFEGGVTSYELTVRASDGTHTIDTTVTVTVTDAAEQPAFGDGSYAFELAENADGRANGLSLGRVTATDPDGDEVRYSLTGGNESMLFNIDAASGELYYVGPGEDYESGVTSYEVTVRASDAAHTVDTTVTVTVTDAAEAPAFGEESYAFELAENVDGSVNWISLGAVTATDPNGDTVRYSLAGGNESRRFAIDADTGEVFYVGSGEDYESGVTSYELTVQASDGTHASAAAVTVALGDVRGHSEPEGGDLPNDRTTTGMVLVDEGAVTGNIEMWWDLDWFAVELVAGRTYQIDFRGQPTGDGTLVDPFLYGVFDGDGRLIPGTTIPDGGTSHNSRLVFTAPREGTYYIATSGNGTHPSGTGTYELEVRDVGTPVFAEAGYRFALTENADGSVNRLSLGLVAATDPDGDAVRYSLAGDNETELFALDAASGELFYVGSGEDFESGVTSYELTVRASDAAHTVDTTVTVTVTDAPEAPAFAEAGYRFALTENADGSVNRLSLGLVAATDPDGDAVRYSLAGDNETELFALDAASGELFYVGSGEDFESGVTSYELTVRASDAAHTVDTTVTVTVTDAPEAPAFAEAGYRFALTENADGSVNRLSLGLVAATDPDGDGAVRYSLAGDNETELFAIDAASGELFYVGSGEDFESGVTSYELTVRASDAAHTVDTTVTVTVTDTPEAPAFEEERYAFALAENTDGSDNRLALGAVTATDPDDDAVRYSLAGGNETELFAIDAASGELYYVGGGEDYESGVTSYELTVQASDGTHPVDTMVTVTVVDDPFDSEKSTGPQGSSEPVGEDLPAGRETSGEVRVDAEPVDGTLHSPSDRDWFAVTLAPGRTYVFALEGDTPRSGTGATPMIRGLRDANGNPVAGIVGGTEVRYATDGAAAEAVYYIEVGGEGGSGQGTSATRGVGARSLATRGIVDTLGSSDGGTGYRLRAHDITETRDATDDYPPATSTTGVVTVDGSVTGKIERSGDRDWFAVELVEGRFYQIDLKGLPTGDGTLRSPYLHGVYDDNGVRLYGTRDDGGGGVGRNSRVSFIAPEDTTYYVAAGAFAWFTGTYTLSVTEVHDDFLPDDYRSDVMTTGTVMVGGSVRGNIERPDDRDWFAVQLEAGRGYWIYLGTDLDPSTDDGGPGSLGHSYLYGVHGSEGNRFPNTASDHPGFGLDSVVTFTPTASGIYHIAAGGHLGDTGTYTLSVKEFVDDFPATTATTGTVEVGGSATGIIQEWADVDWFAVELLRWGTYRIYLEGGPTSAGTLPNPYVKGVYDAHGVSVLHNNEVPPPNSVIFTPTESGTYYVAARNVNRFVNTYQSHGTYRLSVTEVAPGVPDDYGAGIGTTGRVTVGGSVRGEIEVFDDRDWFAVTLEAGRTYRIDLEGGHTRGGTLGDPYLHGVHNANGVLLAGTTNDDGGAGGNSRVTFTAAAPDIYYVAVGAHYYGFLTGTYTLSVTDFADFPDDFPAGTSTTGSVTVGGSATGEINYPEDRDWFAVTLEAGKTYRIDLDGSATRAGTLFDPYLRGVHDGDGVLVDGTTNDDGGAGRNSRVTFTAAGPGTYYVAAGARGESKGTYTLSVTDVTDGVPDDYSADTSRTGSLTVGGSATGEIDYRDDRDWFAVALEAGKTYRVNQDGDWTGDGTLGDPYLRGVHDGDGVLLDGTTNDDGGEGRNSRVFFKAAGPGIYYVAAGAHGDSEGTYTLSVTEIPDDFAAGTGTSGTVEVGGSATGEINYPGDRDWIAVTLEAGRVYQIDLKGLHTGDGTLFDPYLRGVHDGDGVLLDGTTNDDRGAGRNSRVFFKAAEPGIYYVAASADGDSEGTYTLSVTEIPDDFAAGTGTSGTVEVGGSATGEINYPEDRDWFAVTLEADKTYRIDLDGSATRAGTLGDPYLRGVHDGDGVLLDGTTNDDGGAGRNSRVTFKAAEPGIYYVAAGARGESRGTYTLSVTDVTDGVPDDYSADTSRTGSLTVGGSATGEINYRGDRDWFAVTLEAGKTYWVDLEGSRTGDGTLYDPYLRGVYDDNGVLLDDTTDDDGGTGRNSGVLFTAAEPGIYYVAAGADGDSEGTYTLSVREVRDDFASGTGTSGTVEVGGSATGQIDYPEDLDWFAVTLEGGKAYWVDLEGSQTGDGTLYDPYLRGIHDYNGVLLDDTAARGGGTGRNSRVMFTADEPGIYYVAAGPDGDSQGTYTLSVTEIPDDFAAGIGTSGTVEVGGWAAGQIDYGGDRDWFAVTLEAGNTYRIDLKRWFTVTLEGGTTYRYDFTGSVRDPNLRGIHDYNGVLLDDTTNDDGGTGGDSRVFFTPDEAGIYYVSAGAWANGVGTYTLSVEEVIDGM